MPKLRPGFRIKSNERAVFVGATGTGKTTLAKGLLYGRNRLAVLDPKRTFTLPGSWGATTYFDFGSFSGHDYGDGPAIYRPTDDEEAELAEDFFRHVFNEANIMVYVDEAASITTPQRIARHYGRCLREGRERNIGTWSATQRPVFLPRVIFTESEHLFIFRLRHPDDRSRMADYSDPAVETKTPRGHQFWYYNDTNQVIRFYDSAKVSRELTAA